MSELIQSLLKYPPYLLERYAIGITFVVIFTILLFIPRKKSSR